MVCSLYFAQQILRLLLVRCCSPRKRALFGENEAFRTSGLDDRTRTRDATRIPRKGDSKDAANVRTLAHRPWIR